METSWCSRTSGPFSGQFLIRSCTFGVLGRVEVSVDRKFARNNLLLTVRVGAKVSASAHGSFLTDLAVVQERSVDCFVIGELLELPHETRGNVVGEGVAPLFVWVVVPPALLFVAAMDSVFAGPGLVSGNKSAESPDVEGVCFGCQLGDETCQLFVRGHRHRVLRTDIFRHAVDGV